MATLKKYNLEGQEVGEVTVDDSIANYEANGQMIKDYLVALRKNARQWSACTKGRSEVNHSTQKPHKQKGTGKARQGSLSAPQYKGGGVVFGPKPKFDQHVRINRKERRSAIRHLLAERIRDGKVLVIEDSQFDEPKTQRVAKFMKNCDLGKRVLFLGESEIMEVELGDVTQQLHVRSRKHENLAKSVRNLPKTAYCQVSRLGGPDLALARHVVTTEAGLKELAEWLELSSKQKVTAS